jgi:D-sedoheptulose 7-phosphate isomerase
MLEEEVVSLIVAHIRAGGKVLTFGVGGNAANAIHFAAELSGKFEEHENPLPCICLSENPSILTAITNDFGWEHVFSRQILALAKSSDVVVAFSIGTSGAYLKNALAQALVTCKAILICGRSTLNFTSPNLLVWELGSNDTPWVQEEQLRIIHRICGEVKSRLA